MSRAVRMLAYVYIVVDDDVDNEEIRKDINVSSITLPCTKAEFDDSLTDGSIEILHIEDDPDQSWIIN